MATPRPITIAAVGDFMLQRRPERDRIERVKALVSGADLAIANVDTVLSAKGEPTPKWATLRGPREGANDLKAMGFDIVTMANNHTMDYRAEGMLDMRAALIEARVAPVGAGATLAEASAPVAASIEGRTVAVLSLSCTLPAGSPAGPTWPGIAPVMVHQAYAWDGSLALEQPGSMPEVTGRLDEHDLRRALADVAAAKARAEIVLVVVHWGVAMPWRAAIYPAVQPYQRALGRALIDAGADAIIGNHAHELHGIEFYSSRPIAYCLGNFWIDNISNWSWMGRESIVLRLTFPVSGPAEVEARAVWLDDNGWPDADPAARALPILEALSRPDGTSVTARGDRLLVRPLAT
jgi:poly-gamma-glutamate capsule biosynthesis protein CapA/YwtB (metallophosphatase superfamily)